MKKEKIKFHSKRKKIFGILHIPDKGNSRAIIMVHGFGGFAFDKPFEDVAENLCRNDFKVLRFAFRGYDGNGSLKDITISEEMPTLKAAIDFLEKRNISKIGLLT